MTLIYRVRTRETQTRRAQNARLRLTIVFVRGFGKQGGRFIAN